MNILTISKFGTICGKNFTEMFIDEFFNKIENNLEDKKYDIRYNESNNEFIVIFNEQRYTLKLDNETMNNYATGKYNPLTLRIKKIIDKETSREQEEKDIKKTERKKELIINNAEIGILPDDESSEIYLEHLKQEQRITPKKIIEYFKNIRGDLKKTKEETPQAPFTYKWPFNKYCENDIFMNKRVFEITEFVSGISFVTFLCIAFLGGTSLLIALLIEMIPTLKFIEPLMIKFLPLSIALMLSPTLVSVVPISSFITRFFKKRINRLKEFIRDRKLLKHKIKELTEMLTTGKSTSLKEFDSTISMTPIEDIAMFQDNIYQNINDLVNRLTYINKNDRLILAKELKSILDEYNQRMKALEEDIKKGTITLGQDDIVKIKMDIISRIGVVETKLTAIRKKDLESSQRQSEQEIIERKLQQFSEEDIIDEYTDDIELSSSVKTLQRRSNGKN